jgi:uncharacterized protein
MIYFLVILSSLIASFLTFFSGFGLGTILLPVFALYYPLPIAIGLTACVHLLNNVFKLKLVFKNIDWKLVLKFGVPSIIGAFIGASMLKTFLEMDTVILHFSVFKIEFFITVINATVGSVIILFSIIELSSHLSNITFNKKYLISGGIISGFFGGFSGHQGALRSAFLLRLNLDKSIFIATGVFIACCVDVIRLSFYTNFSILKNENINYLLLVLAVFSAWAGAYAGNKLFKKTTTAFFKWSVGGFMLLMGILIFLGIIV